MLHLESIHMNYTKLNINHSNDKIHFFYGSRKLHLESQNGFSNGLIQVKCCSNKELYKKLECFDSTDPN